jgi:mono/diheme cytochrome c family protein
MRNTIAIFLIMLAAIVAVGQTAAKPKVQTVPARYTSPASGKDMFNAYCASCHGTDAKGNGPAASAMKSGVPDLTTLAKKSGGAYPAMHVSQVMIGDDKLAAHGSKEMPVWGPVFSSLSKQSNGEIQQRIHNLTEYIGTMQQK